METKDDYKIFYNKVAKEAKQWKRRNRFYHKSLQKYYGFFIPKGSKIIEIGCGSGELLNSLEPSYGVGIDISEEMIKVADNNFPNLHFEVQDGENIQIDETFDYIILSDLVGLLWDIQTAFANLQKISHSKTRIIISFYNSLWEPVIKTSEFLRLKMSAPIQNWVTFADIENALQLENFEIVKRQRKMLLPKYIPILNLIFNNFLSNLPILNNLSLANFIVAKPIQKESEQSEKSVSVVIPARNEKGNIENAIKRLPKFGSWQEIIYIEGNSSDGTYEEMLRVQDKYKDMKIVVMKQSQSGKGNAVREAFDRATGDILMILDADLTTPPEDMPKFYNALVNGKGEFINGSRLVYPMQKQAMRFLNLLGNKFFSLFFTYLLGQRLKDTLCGTKVLYRDDYQKIKENRSYFGDFDPFGDFDLLFGAARLNMKIVEVIVRYKDREYGSTQISRFRHGWLLIKMSAFAARKIKFI